MIMPLSNLLFLTFGGIILLLIVGFFFKVTTSPIRKKLDEEFEDFEEFKFNKEHNITIGKEYDEIFINSNNIKEPYNVGQFTSVLDNQYNYSSPKIFTYEFDEGLSNYEKQDLNEELEESIEPEQIIDTNVNQKEESDKSIVKSIKNVKIEKVKKEEKEEKSKKPKIKKLDLSNKNKDDLYKL